MRLSGIVYPLEGRALPQLMGVVGKRRSPPPAPAPPVNQPSACGWRCATWEGAEQNRQSSGRVEFHLQRNFKRAMSKNGGFWNRSHIADVDRRLPFGPTDFDLEIYESAVSLNHAGLRGIGPSR